MNLKIASLAILTAAVALAGCGAGQFSPSAVYRPASTSGKPFTGAGIGILPIEDQRPSSYSDSNGGGGPILACLLFGGPLPMIGAHLEHLESGSSQVLNAYNPAMQRMQRGGGGALDPLSFIQQDLIKEFQHSNMLGPAHPAQNPGDAPFTLRATLKSDRLSARTYCYTPMDTTWIWWMLGLPFTTYQFDLKLELALFGPEGSEPLWASSINNSASGTTNFYYATGPTSENNLEQIYDDLLSGAMSNSLADLRTALQEKRPDFWSKIAQPEAPAPRGRGREPQAGPAAGADSQGTPWWKQDAGGDKGQ
jgi:hypothetical protein